MEPAKILIVEDEFIIAEKLSADLSDIGYKITAIVSSGEEALRSVAANPPDLIIMDIHIEGELDGIETTQRIHDEMVIPVMYLTGLTDQKIFQKARKTRPIGYLSKPYNRQDIYHAIELALYGADGGSYSATDKKQQDSACILKDRIFLKDNKNCFNKVSIDDIFWIKGDSSYSLIETKHGKYLTSNNLKTFEKKICNPRFVRIHRSYLVNIAWVKQIVGKSCVVLELPDSGGAESSTSKIEIPIGPEYRGNISRIIRLI